jgi:hypothetical protein
MREAYSGLQWQYKIEQIYPFDDEHRREAEKKMNELGQGGWEAVTVFTVVHDLCVLFKREYSKS